MMVSYWWVIVAQATGFLAAAFFFRALDTVRREREVNNLRSMYQVDDKSCPHSQAGGKK